MAIKVFTDSTSYISEAVRQSLDISVITLSVVFEDEIIEEFGASNEAFYKKMDSVNYFPTSSQPSVELMREMFEAPIKAGDGVFGVFISSEMSGTYQSAVMVKNQLLEEYPDAEIAIVDSRVNCMELGYQAIYAAKAAKNGATIDEVVKAANDTYKRSRFLFTPETLEYLKRGGRIGTAKALLGSVLKLKPILNLKDGRTTPVTSVRTRNKSISRMIEIFDEDVKHFGLTDVVIHHINCEDSAKELAQRFESKTGLKAEISSIGPVVGVHVGPGSIGIVYITKDEMVEINTLEKIEHMVKDNFDSVKDSIGHVRDNMNKKK